MTCSAWSQCCRFSRCGSILTLCATWHGAPRCSSCLSTQPAQLASAGALPLWKHGLLCFALGQGWQCGSQKSQSLEGGETGAGAEFNFSNLKSSAKWSQVVLGRSYRAREHQTLAAQGAGLQSARLAPPSGPSPLLARFTHISLISSRSEGVRKLLLSTSIGFVLPTSSCSMIWVWVKHRYPIETWTNSAPLVQF